MKETLPSLPCPAWLKRYHNGWSAPALAMRYPVGDAFATELMLALYDKLLDKRRSLPAALHLAMDDALKADIPIPPQAPVTPTCAWGRRGRGGRHRSAHGRAEDRLFPR